MHVRQAQTQNQSENIDFSQTISKLSSVHLIGTNYIPDWQSINQRFENSYPVIITRKNWYDNRITWQSYAWKVLIFITNLLEIRIYPQVIALSYYFSIFSIFIFYFFCLYCIICGYDRGTLSTAELIMMATYVELILCFCMYSCKVPCRPIYCFSNKWLVVHDLKL